MRFRQKYPGQQSASHVREARSGLRAGAP